MINHDTSWGCFLRQWHVATIICNVITNKHIVQSQTCLYPPITPGVNHHRKHLIPISFLTELTVQSTIIHWCEIRYKLENAHLGMWFLEQLQSCNAGPGVVTGLSTLSVHDWMIIARRTNINNVSIKRVIYKITVFICEIIQFSVHGCIWVVWREHASQSRVIIKVRYRNCTRQVSCTTAYTTKVFNGRYLVCKRHRRSHVYVHSWITWCRQPWIDFLIMEDRRCQVQC